MFLLCAGVASVTTLAVNAIEVAAKTVAPRERHLCEVHTGRLRAVRMTMRPRLSTVFYVLVIAEVGTQ